MPLNLRATDKFQEFNVPVSYRINEPSGKFLDARNVNTIQGRLDTRFGSSRFNAVSLDGKVKSISTFVKSDGTTYTIAKVDGDLAIVSETGAHTFLGLPLSEDTVHRAVTSNDRHIIALGADGMFSFNGDVEQFSILGQPAPTAPTIAASAGTGLDADDVYKVAITFYASSIGFESNAGESAEVTVSGANLQIAVSNIPSFAINEYVDKVFIYLKNVTNDGEYLYIDEVPLGTTTYTITEESLSSQTPPTKNDIPGRNAFVATGTRGGKFLEFFNSKLVFSGHPGKPNEVYFSEENQPDAFDSTDSANVLYIPGKGAVTGLAVGLFNDSVLDPFLVIFKRKSTHIYSEIGGGAENSKFVTISNEIGCVSQDTVQVKNGVVYFLSEEGWRGISNGRLITNKEGEAITLGSGDVDDIFKSSGFVYEVNRSGLANAFSVYYPTLDQYLTWVSEGQNADYTKCYNYQFDIGGFIPYEFATPATCAALGENANGRDVVLFGTKDGFIMKHSIEEEYSDRDASNTETAINAFAVLPWMPQNADFDATYNFRELILRAITSESALTVKNYIDFNLTTTEESDYDFSDPESGFILDVDSLDEGVLTDGRTIVTARNDINRVGESIAIGFYQQIIGANIGLIGMQIDSSKNGNRNRAGDEEDAGDGSFDEEQDSYFPTATNAVQQCANYLQQIQTIVNSYRLVVANLSERDAIPVSRRFEGLMVYVESANLNYQLIDGIANTDWQPLAAGGGPGTSGTGKELLVNNSANTLLSIGDYLVNCPGIIVEYYLIRRTDSEVRLMNGVLRMETSPEEALSADRWKLFEQSRSESVESGVTFSLSEVDTEKSVLVVNLDNMPGANHSCKFYYKLTMFSNDTGKVVILDNNSINPITAIGEYLVDAGGIIVDYFIYRRTDAGFKTLTGKIIMEGNPDAATNPLKWELFEADRSESPEDSGVTFSLDDVDAEKSILVITLDNMPGADHRCDFYYNKTVLAN